MYKPSKRGAGSRKQAASKIDETAAQLTHWTQVKMGHDKNQQLCSDEMKMYVLCVFKWHDVGVIINLYSN